jgi:titin
MKEFRSMWPFSSRKTRRPSPSSRRPRLEALEDRTVPSAFAVTNTGDNGGVNPAPGAGTGTLRQAIVDANAAATGTATNPDMIQFNILTTDAGYNATTSAFTIAPLSGLPTIKDSLVLNGYSQPGATQNTLLGPAALGSTDPVLHPGSYGDNAVLKIELDGANAGNVDCLDLAHDHITVEGLVINRYAGHGMNVRGGSIAVQGNFLGTEVTGTQALGNSGADIDVPGVTNVTIGGTTPAARNIISGTVPGAIYGDAFAAFGIALHGGDQDDVVQGNFIGTDVTGTKSLGNAVSGINMPGASGNLIGGSVTGAGNLISGNAWGVLDQGAGNVYQDNFIGTDVTGTKPLGNSGDGIFLQYGGSDTFGGVVAGAGNLISGNGESGIRAGGNNSVISGNFIGTDVTGTKGLGSQLGINFQDGGNNNLIGGLDTNAPGGPLAGGGNLISGNGNLGINLSSP